MASKQEINDFRGELEKTDLQEERVLEILEALDKKEITLEIIKETKIGYAVGKLRKHKNSDVVSKSNALVTKWKQLVEPQKSNQSPSQGGHESSQNGESHDNSKLIKKEIIKTESPKTEDKKRKLETPSDSETSKKLKKEKEKVKEKEKYGDADSDDSYGKTRAKAVEMLTQALGSSDAPLSPEDIAKEIEQEMFRQNSMKPKKAGLQSEYKMKLMSLVFNLKNPKNPDLRASLLNGAVTASRLCSMDVKEMASAELKSVREKFTAYHLEAAKLMKNNQTSTDMFKCGKCGGRETTYYQMQTRSADEPMTTFHSCQKCGHRWKS
jgi:transcription elongation factor S-II